MIDLSSSQQMVETKKITRKSLPLTNVSSARWSLPLILVFQALLSWALLRNTAFQDEALYIYAGRQILQHWFFGERLFEDYSYYFSGYPYVYPIIGGGLDMVGGLELVRFFSLICLLTVTACGYYVTNKLFDQKSAVFAALFFVCQGPALYLGRLATYDPLCLCMLSLGTVVAVHASMSRRPWSALGVGPCLVLAFGAKYAALLFMPSIIAILVLSTLLRRGWVSMLVRGSLAMLSLVVVAVLGAIAIARFDPSMFHALGATTTNRLVIGASSPLWLAGHVLQMVGLSYLVGGLVLLFVSKRHLLIVLLFFGSAILVPAYHIYKAELISLDKHLTFSMFFLMPVAGYALASLSGYRRASSSGRYWLAGVAVCLMLFLIGTREALDMYSIWPSTHNLAYAFNTQVRSGSGHYLAEQYEVSRYNLREDTYTWQWTGLDFFEYTDKQGHYYFGKEAYVHAIDDGYFDMIQLNYGSNITTAQLIAKTLEESKEYDLVDKIPYHTYYGTGYFWVWRKH